ncbi:hypothetical protein GGF44_003477, partial [Coemansia sp. RSA 1694]
MDTSTGIYQHAPRRDEQQIQLHHQASSGLYPMAPSADTLSPPPPMHSGLVDGSSSGSGSSMNLCYTTSPLVVGLAPSSVPSQHQHLALSSTPPSGPTSSQQHLTGLSLDDVTLDSAVLYTPPPPPPPLSHHHHHNGGSGSYSPFSVAPTHLAAGGVPSNAPRMS